jgi:hypothetical protein
MSSASSSVTRTSVILTTYMRMLRLAKRLPKGESESAREAIRKGFRDGKGETSEATSDEKKGAAYGRERWRRERLPVSSPSHPFFFSLHHIFAESASSSTRPRSASRISGW